MDLIVHAEKLFILELLLEDDLKHVGVYSVNSINGYDALVGFLYITHRYAQGRVLIRNDF
jgi:hypothetical protein